MYTIEQIRDKIIPVAEEYGLRRVYLFGSYARREATEDSDVDLLVETPVVYGLFAKERLRQSFQERLHTRVDLILMNCFEEKITVGKQFWNDQREEFKEAVCRERVNLFETKQ